MGVALVYGDRQEVLPAVTVTDTLEYEPARAVKRLVSEEGPRTVGWTLGNGEPNLLTGAGPLERIRNSLTEEYNLQGVDPNLAEGIPEDVDALFVVGPQRPFSSGRSTKSTSSSCEAAPSRCSSRTPSPTCAR